MIIKDQPENRFYYLFRSKNNSKMLPIKSTLVTWSCDSLLNLSKNKKINWSKSSKALSVISHACLIFNSFSSLSFLQFKNSSTSCYS